MNSAAVIKNEKTAFQVVEGRNILTAILLCRPSFPVAEMHHYLFDYEDV